MDWAWWSAKLSAALYALSETVKPLVVPFLAYLKGKSDADRDRQREAALSAESYANKRLADMADADRYRMEAERDLAAGADPYGLRRFDEK
jgi:hypothetical protein